MMTTPTDDVPARLYLAIGRLSRSLRRSGASGLGHGSISALSTLVGCGEMRLGDLATKEGWPRRPCPGSWPRSWRPSTCSANRTRPTAGRGW
ncbi:hypothetical protein GCM10029964_002670 [Kibdelosporangium lantanae]